ncbi:Ribonuclease P protein component 2 [uncultured archaeon]|nr:Ribonuclease P protein component 2 [uncultured archaeon]
MYSAMKLKKRYIVFKASAEAALSGEDVKSGLYAFLLKFFGEYGYSKLAYKLLQYEEKTGFGLIRCERSSLHEILGALALIENLNGKKARTIALASSGTIKTLKDKGYDFIKEKE